MTYRIAIGTLDNKNITEHFGQCRRFLIVEANQEKEDYITVEERDTSHSFKCGEHQQDAILDKIRALRDCQIILVKQIGGQSEKLLNHNGMIALQYQGSIEEAMNKVLKHYKKQIFTRKE
jgi:predicted Fe-Mo cluster-binding NifX family protein